jgi:beta-mannosidase
LQTYPGTAGWVHFNEVMRNNIKGVFGEVPEKLDDFILASQVTQAEALKFWMDFWRIGKGHRWGILVWNLRDCWPVVSVSVVDYYNRKNLAYDYLRESQRDVQAICGEAQKGRHPLVIVNDTLQPVQGHVVVQQAATTTPLLECDYQVDANGKAQVGEIPQPEDSQMWRIQWTLKDGRQFTSHYLAAKGVVRLGDYRKWMKELGIRMP